MKNEGQDSTVYKGKERATIKQENKGLRAIHCTTRQLQKSKESLILSIVLKSLAFQARPDQFLIIDTR